MTHARLRHGRASLALSFFVQGVTFALLVTRIPAIQDRYGISDGLLPVFLAAVPILAGVGSVVTEKVVARVRPGIVLRWAQPVVLLALLGVGAGSTLWEAALALGVFGLAVGALDASMNMMGVSLQRAYGRSIMLGFHASYSLGGIAGASMAWAGAHWDLSLLVSYLPAVVVLLPVALIGSRWYAEGASVEASPVEGQGKGAASVSFKLLMPLCLVMSFAYIGDSTVSNWSAKYLQDVLGSSEQLSTVPYNVYMVTTLLGRAVGDLGVRRFGAVAVVRFGSVLAAVGFAVVALAGGAWVGMLGFTLLGLGLCVIVPQTFAAAGRMFPGASDTAIARLNVFNYVGFLVGSPLVGALGDAWSYRGAMLVPMVLVLATLVYAKSFGAEPARYGGGHERPRTVDVG
ncbi:MULTISPECIES: MFS transporter [unclassified Streptomyces]|uniref:MFS transporter n=1 Tax=unclassified Streptomyces TaxID=2593676 RepID=UPI00224EA28B|nr:MULTISPECIES: MFS transporter [unclassified Streptomyces]WSP55806.1 MFS transporter [Streptomyces sp. NBC_01241]WSU23457.1 MFS transporter [Streptomyces sp. NBC_01108]MCX4787516.1 MFS transporter [Streptomyces sp. NBC_01221]MCX4796699.1 MFS transporter [Streptomyces sp. NBC_01242]WSJ37927.1 MFS transporter [Streptomyces sp. NBC_01321]